MLLPYAPVAPVGEPEAQAAGGAGALERLLGELYARQLAIRPDHRYLRRHGDRRFIRDQVQAFEWYSPFLPPGGAVLDWGCNHAPDSCLLRARFGDRFELHGCDFREAGYYEVFHGNAGLSYTRLTDPMHLPYPADSFDAVIGAGVLEHAAVEDEALRNLYRVLKARGILVIYYLPNRHSLEEWYRRVIRRENFHRRLYDLREAERLLKRWGFDPLDSGYHATLWENRLHAFKAGARVRAWGQALSRWVPVRSLCPTLRLVAMKREVM